MHWGRPDAKRRGEMPSKTTGLITLRLPVEVLERVKARANKMGVSESVYVRGIVVLQVMRKHGK